MVNEPTFVLNTKLGGMNWGYCVNEDLHKLVNYSAETVTSGLNHAGTTYLYIDNNINSSIIKIKLYGDRGTGKEVILSSTGFERARTKKNDFKSENVGDIQKIRVIIIYQKFNSYYISDKL